MQVSVNTESLLCYFMQKTYRVLLHCTRLRVGTFLNAFARTRKLVPVQEMKPSVSAPGCIYLHGNRAPKRASFWKSHSNKSRSAEIEHKLIER